ncbi:UDP-2,3-diacylglucosamine diphosphatase LpxI [Rhodobacteraceae bacterium KMM 6894]|nr:UDP-2,3-diacylglucosamine diphosphatase LpxI [Rhodobacteraceae bacterium KMM 6894]
MTDRLAILACTGGLPVALATARPDALIYTLRGVPSALSDRAQEFPIEKIGALFAAMKEAGVTHMVFAGALTRPALNPADLDADMLRLAPRLMAALPQGDDALLRFVIETFEEQGFTVLGAHEVLPDLVAEPDMALGPAPTKAQLGDIARGFDILATTAPLDIGQGCAVAGGQCLGIETVQGTDALLSYVATTPAALKRGQSGVYVKAAKAGQDLRIDMPAIGPDTITGVARAGLAGLAVQAEGVMILERAAVMAALEETGIFLISQAVE